MELTGKELQDFIQENLKSNEENIPLRVYTLLEDFALRCKADKKYDLFQVFIQLVIESKDLNVLKSIGELMSCTDWQSLERADENLVTDIGYYIKNSIEEQLFLSTYQ